MAKKINPVIYRIGTKNDWKFKFIEKKPAEYKVLLFNAMEVDEFLKIYFSHNNLNIMYSKLFLSKNSLNIFIIYDFLNIYKDLKPNSNQVICLQYKNKKTLNFLEKLKIIYSLELKKFFKKKNNNKMKKNIKILSTYKTKFRTDIYSRVVPRSRILTYLSFLKTKLKSNLQNTSMNLFLYKLMMSVRLYFKNKTEIILTLKQIIKNNFKALLSKNKKKKLSLDLVKLRKFERNDFFKEGVNTLYKSKFLSKKAYVIADYLQLKLNQIKKSKTTNYFLYFLKSMLKYFLQKNRSIKGAKILINGNLAKKRRSVEKVIKTGSNISCLKLNSKLNYEESTCFTKKGTFGIKVYLQ